MRSLTVSFTWSRSGTAITFHRLPTLVLAATRRVVRVDRVSPVVLLWKQFPTFREARTAFKAKPCIYAVTNSTGHILKIGESSNLWRRYWGGTGYTLDAALHGSGNLVFGAPAPQDKSERCAI